MLRPHALLILVLVALPACVLSPELPPVQTLIDQQTAITVETMGEPYILASAAGGLAANARDYLDLRVLEIDRMGKRTYLLSLVAFSTIDRRGQPNPTAQGLGTVRLKLGGKVRELVALGETDEAHGLSARLFPRRKGQVGSADYAVTPDLIRELAATSTDDVAVEVGDGGDLRYDPWMPAAEGLRTFAERLPRAGR